MLKQILIDADTGIDDSIAILFALKRPDVRVMGVTTGFGNTTARQAAENSLRLIRLAGVPYEVPVALTLVTLARMTNLAKALEIEPDLPRLLKRVVFMGGTFHAPGNVSPVAEANIAGDPEAADRVFQAGFDLTMVGLDVTQKVRLTTDHVAILDKYAAPENRPIVDYLKQALPFYFRFNRLQNNCLDHCPVHDPLAMLAAVDPSVVTVRTIPARVECGGSFCRGMVVADLREHPIEAPGVSICVDVDSRRALEELLTTFMA